MSTLCKCNGGTNPIMYECRTCTKLYCETCDGYNMYSFKCTTRNCNYCLKGNCWNNVDEDEKYCSNCFDFDMQTQILNANPYSDSETEEEEEEDKHNESNESNESTSSNESDEYDDESDEEDYTYDPGNQLDASTTNLIKTHIEVGDYNALGKTCGINIIFVDKFSMTYDDETKCSICYDSIVNCQVSCGHTYCVNCYIQNNKVMGSKHCAICRELLGNDVVIIKNEAKNIILSII